ncbi:hypothetical protein C0J52_20912 [Blattella germanica]|nr:hypothetical protein C0J52_20912 [Blattella germanica]
MNIVGEQLSLEMRQLSSLQQLHVRLTARIRVRVAEGELVHVFLSVKAKGEGKDVVVLVLRRSVIRSACSGCKILRHHAVKVKLHTALLSGLEDLWPHYKMFNPRLPISSDLNLMAMSSLICTLRISPAERITEGSSFSACFAEHDEDDEERYQAYLLTCFVHLCRIRSCALRLFWTLMGALLSLFCNSNGTGTQKQLQLCHKTSIVPGSQETIVPYKASFPLIYEIITCNFVDTLSGNLDVGSWRRAHFAAEIDVESTKTPHISKRLGPFSFRIFGQSYHIVFYSIRK